MFVKVFADEKKSFIITVHINTGNVAGCNNDHVISFDGTKLYVSAGGMSGGSQIYMLPLNGGESKQITKISPSYLHGISPDSKRFAFVSYEIVD